ncbi:exonuclease SbcCD subunit D C-terminal domain-containing protein [Lewinella sp. W8]|uniref:exonuclease SbcCD subunit D C-terminal domain-containing protein n=1 Tax=Lewinella sp. W8 TaxID=2528208 RepID=UPI0010679530|nr:exonuclease SbcCD subunit D C-terminal domain-containing protein [Lewinella sp. W8]MTB51498.1 exonuclease subunit SbcD [Lewinella sp. W8]
MRILHTSDWHLGHRLYDRDRSEEHAAVFDWLLEVIDREGVEVLIMAGDVFDTMNPSNTARGMYYDFLGRLRRTNCRAAVIVGGNHDSPSLLDAPAELMKYLDVHVIGGARPQVADQLVRIPRDDTSETALWVAAVPYLRDRDLSYSVAGEGVEDRILRVRTAIREHYRNIGEAITAASADDAAPIIATGHLFAAGSVDADDKASHIYLADKQNIEARDFPEIFDYVALGHIHRAQRVGGLDNIRYSGSLIPLTFGEAAGLQQVLLVDLPGRGTAPEITKIPVPRHRQLTTVRGELASVKQALGQLAVEPRLDQHLLPWLDVRVLSDHPLPFLREDLLELLTREDGTRGADILRLSVERRREEDESSTMLPARDLEELDPEDVFYALCQGNAPVQREDYPELLASFRELLNWMNDKSAEQ